MAEMNPTIEEKRVIGGADDWVVVGSRVVLLAVLGHEASLATGSMVLAVERESGSKVRQIC